MKTALLLLGAVIGLGWYLRRRILRHEAHLDRLAAMSQAWMDEQRSKDEAHFV